MLLLFAIGRELAYKKPASQSSTLRDNTAASAANDGIATDDVQSYCSTTQISDEPSWTVDLLNPYRIQRVVIHSRGSLGNKGRHSNTDKKCKCQSLVITVAYPVCQRITKIVTDNCSFICNKLLLSQVYDLFQIRN